MRSKLGCFVFGIRAIIFSVLISGSMAWNGGLASADVIVLANRCGDPLSVEVEPLAEQPQRLKLSPSEVTAVFLDCPAYVTFASPDTQKRYLLNADCAYYFGRNADGSVELQQIGLGEETSTAGGRLLSGSASRTPPATIPVKILVEQDEPTRQTYWEPLLRHRIEAASAILEKHCRVRLQVVAVDTWKSGAPTNDFFASLAEFEREVQPSSARLAIGFTRQWSMDQGRTHLAGTRGPLHTHILVREGSRGISEPERLELLVHELGHYLGASHSPEHDSVMRPVLDDDLSMRADFRIQFDPVNTLIIAMVGEELRRRNLGHISDLSAVSKRRLRQIYDQLSRSMPDDAVALHYMKLMSIGRRPTDHPPAKIPAALSH